MKELSPTTSEIDLEEESSKSSCCPIILCNRKGICDTNTKRYILCFAFLILFCDKLLMTLIVPIYPNILWTEETLPLIKKACNVTSLLEQSSLMTDNCVTALFNMTNMKDLIDSQNTKNGLVFATKTVLQLLSGPLVGLLTNRIGYSIPILCGLSITFGSTLIYSFGNSFVAILLARCFHGIGGSLSVVSAKGLLVTTFQRPAERFQAISCALSGSSIGILFGPFLAGIIFHYTTKEIPFIIIGLILLVLIGLQIVYLKPKFEPEHEKGLSIFTMCCDPYIFSIATLCVIEYIGVGALESSLPLWMKTTMGASRLEQSLVFLSATITGLIGVNIFGLFSTRISQWIFPFVLLIVMGICLLGITFCRTTIHVLLVMLVFGFFLCIMNVAVMVIIATIVDLRFVSVYGTAFAIHDICVSSSFVIGPLISVSFVKLLNFKWMIRIAATITILAALLSFVFKNVKPKESYQPIEEEESTKLAPSSIGYSEKMSNFTESSAPKKQLLP